MIEQMRYVTVTGPADNIDWAIEHYLGRHKIHLEYATQRLKEFSGLRAFTQENPYQESAERSAFFLELLGDVPPVYFPMTGKQAQEALELAYQRYEARSLHLKNLEEMRDTIEDYIETLRPFASLDAELKRLDNFEHIQHFFGKMPLENYLQFKTFLYDDVPILFIETFRDSTAVWGCFFAAEKGERIFAAYNFEPIPISASCLDEVVSGTPVDILAYWEKRLVELCARIQEMVMEALPHRNALLSACHTVQELYRVFAIKQYAAKTENHYIFVGWMPLSEAIVLEREAANDENTIVVHFEEENPPTKLNNPPGIRNFEFFVRLYGTPKYNEIDPTPILAVAYILLFGMMFGDIGHGLGLALLGMFVRNQLGGVMVAAGISATFFGFIYGSIFGMEDIVPALWRHPIQNIGGTLLFAVVLGVVVILLTMMLNMANAIKQKDSNKLFFSPNGVAGIVLYITIIAVVLEWVPWYAAILPLAAIVIKGMAHQESSGIAMTMFQRVLGIFEILLAYLTNTISFVRVGAFALSHAGMMHVVMMLSAQGSAENRNVPVLVLGNIIVMAIEGLLIGIQSLRLGFYEIFSRFYEGGGRAFEATGQKG